MAIPPYKYTPLPVPADGERDIHIRLMKLPPGENTGEISCSIVSCPLQQALCYEAVSYCWGDENNKAQITCEGQSITVPSNLHAFLLHTRAKGTERTLWVDSICINQGDEVEKGSQVAAMRHIYHNAMRTLIWLGKEAHQSTLGLEFARKLSNAYRKSFYPELEKRKAWWHRPKFYDDFSSVFGQEWGAYFRLFDREWFTRAWVVQEVVMSKEPWVICGDKAIQWSELIWALTYVTTVQVWIIEFYGSTNLNHLILMELSQLEVTHKLKPAYYKVLIRHRQAFASDTRDHIFAYYGISSHHSLTEHKIEPNYIQSSSKLYTDIAVSTLRKASDLDFLDIPRLSRDNELNLPSWVPNWSFCGSAIAFSLLQLEYIQGHEVPYAATKGSKYTPTIDSSLTHLELLGYTVDRIVSVSNEWVVQDTTGYQSVRKQAQVLSKNQGYIREWEGVIGLFSKDRYPTGESRRDVLWQICVAGVFINGKEKTEQIYDQFDKRQYFLRILTNLHLHNFITAWMFVVVLGHILRVLGIPNPEISYRTLVAGMINRKAMRSVGGYAGMVPKIAEVGDFIVLCKGGKLPLILRPLGKDWEFIGDCYVHGMMNGELWEEKEERWEKFVLV